MNPTLPLVSPDAASLHHLELAADIVAAFVSHNSVPVADLPNLIDEVLGALLGVGGSVVSAAEPPKPAVPARESVTEDYIVCLEDGRRFKSLKRHLRTRYDMSPEQYREKWGLASDYPMVAPSYAKARSLLAKKTGLGQHRGRRT